MKKKISRNQIQRIYSSGNKIKSEIFILFWEFSYDKHDDSVAVISIPKNKIKKAVDRNKLKRRIKEILSIKNELAYPIFDLKINFILIYNKNTVLNFKQINKDLVNLFDKLRIKVNESI
tara:strand:- start:3739 stop:4095 length:357 start_codon:yes stop_codon:yes gene_type:complete